MQESLSRDYPYENFLLISLGIGYIVEILVTMEGIKQDEKACH